MFTFRKHLRAPHLRVRLSDRVRLRDLVEEAPAFEHALRQVDSGFVLMIDTSELKEVDDEAVGVMFYLLRCIFNERPSLFLLVDAERFDEHSLCSYMERQDRSGSLRHFQTCEEAINYVEQKRPDMAFDVVERWYGCPN